MEQSLTKEPKAELRAQKQQKAAADKAWKAALIKAKDMPAHLGINKSEFDQWKKDGRIPISKVIPFRQWG